MKATLGLSLCAVVLAACGEAKPADSVESLLADPQRHKKLRAQCKADHARMGDALCSAVAEATRRRFLGSGTPYTPAPAPAPPTAATARE